MLVLRSNVDGARVTAGALELGHTPLTADVAPGELDLVLSHEGYMPARRKVTIPAGGTESIRMDLVPLAGGPPQALRASFLFGFAYGVTPPASAALLAAPGGRAAA